MPALIKVVCSSRVITALNTTPPVPELLINAALLFSGQMLAESEHSRGEVAAHLSVPTSVAQFRRSRVSGRCLFKVIKQELEQRYLVHAVPILSSEAYRRWISKLFRKRTARTSGRFGATGMWSQTHDTYQISIYSPLPMSRVLRRWSWMRKTSFICGRKQHTTVAKWRRCRCKHTLVTMLPQFRE